MELFVEMSTSCNNDEDAYYTLGKVHDVPIAFDYKNSMFLIMSVK